MGPTWTTTLIIVTIMSVVVAHQVTHTGARTIGVCYGTQGDNLPSPKDVINLYNKSGFEFVRLYEPLPHVLDALRRSQLPVSLGVRNEDVVKIATSQSAANDWVQANIIPYKDDVLFGWITVGNEVIPGSLADYVPLAMGQLFDALSSAGLLGTVKVTTVVPSTVLSVSYPPSVGSFSPEVINVMTKISGFLFHTGAPLMINVYPYFAYASNPNDISLDYALFKSQAAPVIDGSLQYFNLFDAMVDAFNAALEKIDFSEVRIAIAESGWPSAGNEPYSSIENAKTYNTNLIKHVLGNGTPRRPDHRMDTFLFSMFNEDLKPAGVEQNFGLFYPNMEPVYPLSG